MVVSVCTGGDSVEIIQENIEYFLKQNCNIAISAYRSKAGSKWKLETFADDNGYKFQKYVMPYAEFLYKKVRKNGK